MSILRFCLHASTAYDVSKSRSIFKHKYVLPLKKLSSCNKITKGQLISKCPVGIIVWTKIPTKLFLDFCPEFFCSFLRASWKLFGLSGDLVSLQEAPKSFQEAPRKVQKISGQKSRNNFVGIFVITIIPKGHFEIN